ncbi:ribbon-helix-helix protein, CopG family [Agrobacterium larrymoorei]|uniref:CopG family ribbon-helix-helix protein n=1 Tax=Agrobacterium larrymoorei TaxID=160699 RepID=UPI001573FD49|nr:ribbon-helix-helix protein, CopG family [Agrobacterium larrymoorei]NTJ41695.1 ribbon-helix-helix protein, CopG family [Agrobacterium larrymoorei]
MRLPQDILAEIEQIANACDKTRSWVFVRALKSYLATEGREIIELANAREQIEDGQCFDLDDVIAEVDEITKGAAA